LKDECTLSQAQVEEELRAIAKVDLPDFDEPVKYFFKDSLPHTGQGKIDYRMLEEEAEKSYK
jgi:acyl-coenzyme A synthetase/AMP-(fatty) acid ligase